MKPRVRAQLHSSSARSSKIIKDHTQIKTVVEVEGVGRLVLEVDSRGGYSLRAHHSIAVFITTSFANFLENSVKRKFNFGEFPFHALR